MLEVIGAGATAQSTQDWHQSWLDSQERRLVQDEISHFHNEGQKKGAVETTLKREFATNWFYQVQQNLVRLGRAYWRDVDYIMSKFALSALGGLIIGFTFFQSPDSQQGTQNKLFVRRAHTLTCELLLILVQAIFMATILSVPLSNQTQVPFINIRNIYEIRERPSRMYSWTALVTAQIMVEIPLNIVTSAMIFFTWFWTVGFDSNRAGFMFLTLVIGFPMYYQTFSQTVAAMSPNVEIAGLLFSFLFSFVITFNGVMQPFRQLGWWRWYVLIIRDVVRHMTDPSAAGCTVCLRTPTSSRHSSARPSASKTSTARPSSLSPSSLPPVRAAACSSARTWGRQAATSSTRTLPTLAPSARPALRMSSWATISISSTIITGATLASSWPMSSSMCVAILVMISIQSETDPAAQIFLVFVCTYLFRIRTGSLIPSFKRRK